MTHEPPIPQPVNYPRSYDAARRTTKPTPNLPVLFVSLAVLAIVMVVGGTVAATGHPATAAADSAAVVSTRRPAEYAPPVAATIPGDGMWLVGKHVKPGVYRSTAGRSCYWERLAGLSGSYVDLIANGGFRRGPYLVEIKAGDFAFTSQGCGNGWVMVR
jgi:hypothetical protein